MKILVTGANGDIGEAIGRLLKEVLPKADISGADISGQWPGGFVFKNMINIVPASDSRYLDRIQVLAKNFDLIIPTSEPELACLSNYPDVLDRLPLLMVPPEVLRCFMDKYETILFFEKNGLKAPKTKLLSEVRVSDLPAYIKPRKGAGARGHRLILGVEELMVVKKTYGQDWIAQEYLPDNDNEFTCAIFRYPGVFRSAALKRQLQGDKTIRAEVVDCPTINKLLIEIAELIDLKGCINVQLKMTEDGPRVFEINPRLSSTVLMRHRLGFKDCEWWVKSYLGMKIDEFDQSMLGGIAYRMSVEYVTP
jgi:carbamoyl-phosphate synthase large subunit